MESYPCVHCGISTTSKYGGGHDDPVHRCCSTCVEKPHPIIVTDNDNDPGAGNLVVGRLYTARAEEKRFYHVGARIDETMAVALKRLQTKYNCTSAEVLRRALLLYMNETK